MEIAGIRLNDISSKNTAKLDQAYKELKKTKTGASQPTGAAAVNKQHPPPTPMPKLNAREYKSLIGMADRTSAKSGGTRQGASTRAQPQADENEGDKKARAELSQKQWHIDCVIAYKTRPATRIIPGMQQIPTPNLTNSLIVCKTAHDQCKALLGRNGADTFIRSMIDMIPVAMEAVTMDYGFNPLEMDLRGLGMEWRRAQAEDKEILEPEATEIVIEWESMCTAPNWARLLKKFMDMGKYYSDSKRAERFADMGKAAASQNLHDRNKDL